MRVDWNQVPIVAKGADVFNLDQEGSFSVDDFLAGVGQVIRAAGHLPATQELQRFGSLPMRHMLDEMESDLSFGPRTQTDQDTYERVCLLQELASIRDSRIGAGLKEIEIAAQEDGLLAWTYFR